MDDSAARGTDGLLQRLRPRAGVVDLSRVEWVRPALIVGVAALAHRAAEAGEQLAVSAPIRPDPAGYAARMRLGRMLGELGVAHDLPTTRERDRRDSLIELSVIDGDEATNRLAALVYRKLRPVDAALARALHGSVGEIGANAAEHSGTIGYLAAVTLPRRNELLLAVGDAGVGIRSTLAHRGATDDEHAIELASHERVSRLDEPGRGHGLPTAIRLINGQRGSLYIASGSASIRYFGSTRRFLAAAPSYPGAILEARIPLSAPAIHSAARRT